MQNSGFPSAEMKRKLSPTFLEFLKFTQRLPKQFQKTDTHFTLRIPEKRPVQLQKQVTNIKLLK